MIAVKGEIVQGERRETEYEGWLWCQNSDGVNAWVPETYLEKTQDSGQFRFLKDYNSRELRVNEGQEVLMLYEDSGWAWVRNTLGEEGWIPLENVKDLKDRPDSIPDLMG
jgi:hypothetical protein